MLVALSNELGFEQVLLGGPFCWARLKLSKNQWKQVATS